jgi:hypothetical protein
MKLLELLTKNVSHAINCCDFEVAEVKRTKTAARMMMMARKKYVAQPKLKLTLIEF